MTDLPSVDVELAGIRATMGDPHSAYNRDGGATQQRYHALTEAKAAGVAPQGAQASEIAAIKATLGDPSSPYHRDGGVTQRRYLALLEAAEDVAEPVEDDDGVIRIPSAAAWDRMEGDPADHHHYVRIAGATNALIAGVPADAVEAFRHCFHGLPQSAQAMALAELGNRRPVSPEAVTADDLAALRARLPALAREWGSAAPQRLGAVRARLWRAVGRMDDEGARAALQWLDGLPEAALVALARTLAK